MADPVGAGAAALRPSLIVKGDCQGEILVECLRSAPAIAGRYDIAYLRPREDHAAIAPELWRRCAIFWRQVGSPVGRGEDEAANAAPPGLDPRCLTVTYPALWFPAIWPHHVWDPLFWDPALAGRREDADAHVFRYADRILIQLSKSDLEGPALFSRYLELDAARAGAAERMLELSLRLILARDEQVDVPMGRFIADNFAARRLFHAFNHPGREVYRELLRRLVRATWPAEAEPGGGLEALHADCPYLDPLSQKTQLIRMYDDPVSPGVAAALGLAWWSPDDAYLIRPSGGGWGACLLHEYVHSYVAERRLRRRLTGSEVGGHAAMPLMDQPEPAPDARRLLAESHASLARGDTAAAIAAARAACAAAPSDSAAAIHFAYLMVENGAPAEAEQACLGALALAPADAGAHHAFSLFCTRAGRMPEAIAAARKASLAAPGNMHAAAHLGNLLRRAGEFQGAEAAYRLAIAAAPAQASLHVALGELYAEFGLWQDAEASARRATELAPGDGRARSMLERALAQL